MLGLEEMFSAEPCLKSLSEKSLQKADQLRGAGSLMETTSMNRTETAFGKMTVVSLCGDKQRRLYFNKKKKESLTQVEKYGTE